MYCFTLSYLAVIPNKYSADSDDDDSIIVYPSHHQQYEPTKIEKMVYS